MNNKACCCNWGFTSDGGPRKLKCRLKRAQSDIQNNFTAAVAAVGSRARSVGQVALAVGGSTQQELLELGLELELCRLDATDHGAV